MSESDNPRPILVTLVGALYLIIGLLSLVAGLLVAFGVDLGGTFEGIIGGAGVVSGIIALIIGFGFIKGWSIMWYLGVIFGAIFLILGIASIVMGSIASVVIVIIDLIILLYLFKSNVKKFFLD